MDLSPRANIQNISEKVFRKQAFVLKFISPLFNNWRDSRATVADWQTHLFHRIFEHSFRLIEEYRLKIIKYTVWAHARAPALHLWHNVFTSVSFSSIRARLSSRETRSRRRSACYVRPVDRSISVIEANPRADGRASNISSLSEYIYICICVCVCLIYIYIPQ